MTRDPQRLLDRKLALAKLALLWEALWRAAFPAMMIVGLVALAVLTGVLSLRTCGCCRARLLVVPAAASVTADA